MNVSISLPPPISIPVTQYNMVTWLHFRLGWAGKVMHQVRLDLSVSKHYLARSANLPELLCF